jgi:lipopolysaccharide/colanic/teichoic acid biosynthesis glycosyltransferase
LVVADQSSVLDLRAQLATYPEAGLAYAGCHVPDQVVADNDHLLGAEPEFDLAGIDHVLVDGSGPASATKYSELAWWEAKAVTIVLPLAHYAAYGLRGRLGGRVVVCQSQSRHSLFQRAAKRSIDILFATALMCLLSPLFLVTAIAIRLDDRGPVFYRQRRVGRFDRTFSIWKFRSMVEEAHAQQPDLAHASIGSGLLFKLHADPRVTRVGYLIRRLSVDELPQLINVLLGRMSLVGPRPLPVAPEDFDERARRRHAVRPGMTGPWQVEGANSLSYDEMIDLDLAYVAHWSLRGDALLLARTIGAILVRRSAF